MIPIQITNNMPTFNLINGKPGEACNGFNGNLNSWYYGLNNEVKNKLTNEYNNMAKLAQYDTVNSPYYTQVTIDPRYVKYLEYITTCNKK